MSMLRRPAPASYAPLALLAVVAALALACSTPRDPIVVDEGRVIVENMTGSEWRDVRVVVNDHFGGGVSSLAPGGRLDAPLSDFQTGLGQKFDRGRQSVFKVEVTATDASGQRVSLAWAPNQPQ